MEEERKEVVEVEEERPQQQDGMGEENKHSLITFILSVIGFGLAAGFFVGAIVAIVLGAIAKKRLNNSNPTRQPFKTFDRISKPVSIVDIILGILSLIGWTVWAIVMIVLAVIAYTEGAA